MKYLPIIIVLLSSVAYATDFPSNQSFTPLNDDCITAAARTYLEENKKEFGLPENYETSDLTIATMLASPTTVQWLNESCVPDDQLEE